MRTGGIPFISFTVHFLVFWWWVSILLVRFRLLFAKMFLVMRIMLTSMVLSGMVLMSGDLRVMSGLRVTVHT